MIHHRLAQQRGGKPGWSARHLRLHEDNCAGQNTNKYVLWYVSWMVWVGLEDTAQLLFFVAGHTKKVCDGAFGHVKHRLSHTDAKCPKDMMDIIEWSRKSTTCIPGTHFNWRSWTTFLGQFFCVPSKFAISKYHVFTACKEKPVIISAKRFTGSGRLTSSICLRSKHQSHMQLLEYLIHYTVACSRCHWILSLSSRQHNTRTERIIWLSIY